MSRLKEIVSTVDERTLVALVTELSGGSVSEQTIREQRKRLRRKLELPPDIHQQAA